MLKPSAGDAELVQRRLELLHHRIVRLLRMQRILDRALDRLVMLRERPVGQGAERSEESADAFGIHDERAHVIFGMRVGLEVGHVVADPLLPPLRSTRPACASGSHGFPSGSQEARL